MHLVTYVEPQGGRNELAVLRKVEMQTPPRKSELVSLRLTLGGPILTFRVQEVVWVVGGLDGPAGDRVDMEVTVVLARQYSEEDFSRAVQLAQAQTTGGRQTTFIRP